MTSKKKRNINKISDFWVKEQCPYDKWGNSLLRIYLITNGNNGNKIIFMHIVYFQFNCTIKNTENLLSNVKLFYVEYVLW